MNEWSFKGVYLTEKISPYVKEVCSHPLHMWEKILLGNSYYYVCGPLKSSKSDSLGKGLHAKIQGRKQLP